MKIHDGVQKGTLFIINISGLQSVIQSVIQSVAFPSLWSATRKKARNFGMKSYSVKYNQTVSKFFDPAHFIFE